MIIENASLADTDRVIELERILENTELDYARCKEIFEAQLKKPLVLLLGCPRDARRAGDGAYQHPL